MHEVSKQKSDLFTTNLIDRVNMQSFFSRSHYRLFIVYIKLVIEFNLSACNKIKDVIQEYITNLYNHS